VLLREDGRTAYLCDFGIASSPGQELTRTGALVGSMAYMAPERHAAETASSSGVAADIYATGCLFWHVLTGSQPYVGTEAEVAKGHLEGPIPQLPGKDEFAKKLNAFLRRAMAKDPRQRYPSARAMLAELTALRAIVPGVLALPEVTAIRQSVVATPPGKQVRRRVLAVALVMALVGGAVYVGSLIGGVSMVPTVLGTDTPSTTAAQSEPSQAPPSDWSGAPSTSAPPKAKFTERAGVNPAEEGVVEEPVAIEPQPEAPATKAKPRSKPRQPRTTAPAPAPTTSAAPQPSPAPAAKFRCWNGARVAAYSSCSWPAGFAGSEWVFPRRQAVPNCKRMGPLSGRVIGWACPVRFGDGTTGQISLQQWRTVNAAESYFWNRYVGTRDRARGPWVINQTYFGRSAHGWLNRRGGPAHAIRIYGTKGTQPWVLAVQAPTTKKRATAFSRLGFRSPARFRGVPSADASPVTAHLVDEHRLLLGDPHRDVAGVHQRRRRCADASERTGLGPPLVPKGRSACTWCKWSASEELPGGARGQWPKNRPPAPPHTGRRRSVGTAGPVGSDPAVGQTRP
jgi:hypothetical protein